MQLSVPHVPPFLLRARLPKWNRRRDKPTPRFLALKTDREHACFQRFRSKPPPSITAIALDESAYALRYTLSKQQAASIPTDLTIKIGGTMLDPRCILHPSSPQVPIALL